MNRGNLIVGVLLLTVISPRLGSAQQQRMLYSFSYYKVLPGKEQQIRRMMETVDRKVQQERVNNGAISSWYVYEVLNPTGSSAEYDYVMMTTVTSFKAAFESPYTFDSALRKIFSRKDAKFFADYYASQTTSCKLVKQEIYAAIAVADSSFPSGPQLKYIVTDFMQPKPGKAAQYVNMEIDTFRLVHRERVKLNDISQWLFLQLAFPFDMNTGYGYLALNFYRDLDKAFGIAKYEEGLKKTFPGVSLSELFQTSASTRDNPRAEILRLFLYALPGK